MNNFIDSDDIKENDTLYVIKDKNDKILFRCRESVFHPEVISSSYIFPVPKIIVVKAGEISWEIGKNTFDIKAGDIVLLRPGTIRRIEKYAANKIACNTYEFVPSFLYGTPCLNLFMMNSDKTNTVIYGNNKFMPEITRLLDMINHELLHSLPMGSDMIRGLMMCALSMMIRALGMDLGVNTVGILPDDNTVSNNEFDYIINGIRHSTSPTDHSVSMSYVMNMIRSNISGDISIDALAEAAHMSRSHFFKIFKKYNKLSINDYILKCRVENTVKLLLESKCNILDAAYASGFTSSSGFYKAFKKITGRTPKEYLSEMKKQWKMTDDN